MGCWSSVTDAYGGRDRGRASASDYLASATVTLGVVFPGPNASKNMAWLVDDSAVEARNEDSWRFVARVS